MRGARHGGGTAYGEPRMAGVDAAQRWNRCLRYRQPMKLAEAYRAAVRMQTELGSSAAIVAAQCAEDCRAEGDLKGFDGWNLVCACLTEMKRCSALPATAVR